MLKFLQEFIDKQYQSYKLSNQNLDAFSKYLHDPETSEIPEPLVALPLFLPQMLQELTDFIRDTKNLEMKALAGGLYTYVFNPYDYIDDEVLPPLGLVDDTLIVFYGMEIIEAATPNQHFSALQNSDLTELVQKWESLLAADLVTALKTYPRHISDVLATTNFENQKIS